MQEEKGSPHHIILRLRNGIPILKSEIKKVHDIFGSESAWFSGVENLVRASGGMYTVHDEQGRELRRETLSFFGKTSILGVSLSGYIVTVSYG